MNPTRLPDRPRPLVRQTTTVAMPGSDCLSTVQLVIIAGIDAVEDPADVVRWEDLPESREAGWFHLRTLKLDFHVRLID